MFPRFKTEAGRERYAAAYKAALQDWPVPCDELEIPTGLGVTHVIASGAADAPPLILLPSFAATALVWRPNVAALARTHRVYAIDLIGQPGLSVAQRRIDSPRVAAGWLAELMDGLGVARAPLIGCSYGGFLAANQALRTPHRVERLVMIGPVGVFFDMSWRLALRMRLTPLRRWIARRLGTWREPDARTLHAGAAPLHAEDDGWRRLMGVTMSESAEVSLAKPFVFSRGQLRRITAPALLLVGRYERLYDPQAVVQRALAMMPGLEAEIVEGADHIAAMAQPDLVNARIAAFLDLRAGDTAR